MSAWPRVVDVRAAEAADLAPVAEHVRAGGLIAYPTETVYGLGGAASSPEAAAAIRRLKASEPDKPLIVLVPSAEAVGRLAWTDAARGLARAFWPGSLTLVLEDREGIFPPNVGDPHARTVAVRVSPHPLVARLVRELGPLTSTSLNRSGEPPAASGVAAVEAVRRMGGRDVIVLDAGELPPSAPSTVVDCTGPVPRVIRPGALPAADVQRVLMEIDGHHS
ncbi:MAG TPA: L-threonylcarbamoyladenylate synthase [Longimicrobiales bacterium]|nr:L-threonylcarbamoyladenylate synthase [Longimicrobiales bacterium]